jgi:hypothetical protein
MDWFGRVAMDSQLGGGIRQAPFSQRPFCSLSRSGSAVEREKELSQAACDATPWFDYQQTSLKAIPDTRAYFYVTKRMAIDADGAPNAYHPQDTGLDALANAGYPQGHWKSILVVDPGDPQKPFIQTSGAFAGFFLSQTTLQAPTLFTTDPQRYVDSTRIPYVVFPGAFYAKKRNGRQGRFCDGQKP